MEHIKFSQPQTVFSISEVKEQIGFRMNRLIFTKQSNTNRTAPDWD